MRCVRHACLPQPRSAEAVVAAIRDFASPVLEAVRAESPFHRYSTRQAIEEGFILDVLAHYTAYWRLLEKIETDPGFGPRYVPCGMSSCTSSQSNMRWARSCGASGSQWWLAPSAVVNGRSVLAG